MTFNDIQPGDFILAAPVMQNFRHINYGNPLLPTDSAGAFDDDAIDLGSSSFGFKEGFFTDTVTTDKNFACEYLVATDGIDTNSLGFVIKTKRINTGAWNLQSGADYEFLTVAHGMTATDVQNIMFIECILVSDDDAVIVPLHGANNRADYISESRGANGGIRYIDSTNVYIGADYDVLKQYPGGGNNWNDAVKNRGTINVFYKATTPT